MKRFSIDADAVWYESEHVGLAISNRQNPGFSLYNLRSRHDSRGTLGAQYSEYSLVVRTNQVYVGYSDASGQLIRKEPLFLKEIDQKIITYVCAQVGSSISRFQDRLLDPTLLQFTDRVTWRVRLGEKARLSVVIQEDQMHIAFEVESAETILAFDSNSVLFLMVSGDQLSPLVSGDFSRCMAREINHWFRTLRDIVLARQRSRTRH